MTLKKKTIRYLNQTSWYHGTSVSGYQNIEKHGIEALYNINNELDFGPGFYLAPEKNMAAGFVTRMLEFQKQIIPNITTDAITPVVLEIEFTNSPYTYFTDETYRTGTFENFDEEFARFIFHNRTKNVGKSPDHGYDMIYGVMSDNNPTLLISQFKANEITEEEVIMGIIEKKISTKQLSIHNQEICGILKIKDVHTIEHKEVESV